MADLLDGATDHIHYAPLSHSQTLAIGRHLQDQIRDLQDKMASLTSMLDATNEGQRTMRGNKDDLFTAVRDLQDDLANTKTVVDSTRKELGRTNSVVQKLQTGLEQSNENIAALRDGHKVTNMNLNKVAVDLNNTTAIATKLQETVERKVEVDLLGLTDELSKTNLDMKHLRADEQALKKGLHEAKEVLRECCQRVKGLSDSVSETNTVLNINEQRLGDTVTGLKNTRQNVEDLTAAHVKLHEEHEMTKANTADLQAGLRKVQNHAATLHEGLDKTSESLAGTQSQLNHHRGVVEKVRFELGETRGRVQVLKEGQEMAKSHIHHLRGELTEVSNTAQRVQAGLKEQSTLLLPNIHLDSPEARAITARHGSLLHNPGAAFNDRNQGGGTGTTGASPRKAPSRSQNNRGHNSPTQSLAWT